MRDIFSTAVLYSCFVLVGLPFSVSANQSPWGVAEASIGTYEAQKVVYDVGAMDLDDFSFILDRVSFLKNLYVSNPLDASIVLVLHGAEVPFFAIENYPEYKQLMNRAHSLAIDGIVEFRMCTQAAGAHGFQPNDMHGFIKIVPMADAEIVMLQQLENYVYMR